MGTYSLNHMIVTDTFTHHRTLTFVYSLLIVAYRNKYDAVNTIPQSVSQLSYTHLRISEIVG